MFLKVSFRLRLMTGAGLFSNSNQIRSPGFLGNQVEFKYVQMYQKIKKTKKMKSFNTYIKMMVVFPFFISKVNFNIKKEHLREL